MPSRSGEEEVVEEEPPRCNLPADFVCVMSQASGVRSTVERCVVWHC
jgi:hypothetical protein